MPSELAPRPQAVLEALSVPPTLVDTHAHLHFEAFAGDVPGVLHRAAEAGVAKLLTVGVNTADSRAAVTCAATYANVWAAVGVHPHEAGEAEQGAGYLRDLAARRQVVAIGECGLDYFKARTTPQQQERALRLQIELAFEQELPLIFHVREAFDDFFKIAGDYSGLRGVVHSFSADLAAMERSVAAGLYVALNGIMTFTKDEQQLEAARRVPPDRLLLETDSPFLSPVPHRGKTNEPARGGDIATFVAGLRGESVEQLARSTTQNAQDLFGI